MSKTKSLLISISFIIIIAFLFIGCGSSGDNDSGGSHDTTPPSKPNGFTRNAVSTSQINLSWNACTDNVGVAGYKIYKNGSSIPFKTISGTSTSDTGLYLNAQYCYTVSAYDAAGNESQQSNVVCINVDGNGVILTDNELKNEILSKSQEILPQEEYLIIEQLINETPSNLNSTSDLNQLRQSIDEYNKAVQALENDSLNLLSNTSYFPLREITQDNISRMKSMLGDIFGNFGTTEGKRAFLNAGIGWASGQMGGAEGSLDAIYVVGVEAAIAGGGGVETIYDFMNFNKYNSEIVFCSPGVKILIGPGAGVSACGNITSINYEKWIFGFENKEIYSKGTSLGEDYSIGLTGELSASIGFDAGLSASFGSWQEIDASCSLGLCVIPQGSSNKKYGISYVVGAGFVGGCVGVKGEISGSLGASNSATCSGQPYDIKTFLNDSMFGNRYRYSTAGFKVAKDIITSSSVSSTTLLASAVAILHGIYYDEELINTNDNDISSPSRPTGLSANAVSSSQINLSWNASNDNIGVEGYKIYRDLAVIKTVNASSTSDTGLNPNTNYCYTVSAYDAAGNESEQSSQACSTTMSLFNTSNLPDTGQTQSYTDTFGEDSDYTINPPSYTDNGNGTVTDNVTGLMWQKEDDNVRRTWSDADNYCNDISLAGNTDWRVPSTKELITIFNYGTHEPAIDTTYFLNTKTGHRDGTLYWSSTIQEYSSEPWRVDFYSGEVYDYYTSKGYVRCVRGGQVTAQSFTTNGDGTVKDNVTGLIWQQEDDNVSRDWEAAIMYCDGLNLGGQSNWRLPNVKELASIMDYSEGSPAIDTTYFPNAYIRNTKWIFWSSTTASTDLLYDLYAWYVETSLGYIEFTYKSSEFDFRNKYVRCVRGGQ